MTFDPEKNPFKILEIQKNHSFATSHDLFVALFYVETTASAVSSIVVHLSNMAERNKGQANIINILSPSASVPNAETRSAMIKAFSTMRERSDLKSIVVFDGSGTKAAIVRSVVTSWSLFAKSTLPIDVFSSTQNALASLGPRLKGGPTVNAAALTEVLAAIASRRQLILKK